MAGGSDATWVEQLRRRGHRAEHAGETEAATAATATGPQGLVAGPDQLGVGGGVGARPQLGGDPVRRGRPLGRRQRCGVVGQLAAEQPPVLVAPADQLGVGTQVDDPAVDDHRDPIRQGQGRPAVGDQDGGPVLGDPVQRRVDRRLGGRVDGAGRIVQHEHPRVGEQGPGQREPLALSAGQGQPAFADHRAVAVGQRLDELRRLGRLGGGPDVLVGGVRAAVGDVGGDAVGEQERLLEHHPDRGAQVGHGQVAHVDPTHLDGAVPAGRRTAAAAATRSTCRTRTRRPGPRSSPAGDLAGRRRSQHRVGRPE